jgi:hypothetical protein
MPLRPRPLLVATGLLLTAAAGLSAQGRGENLLSSKGLTRSDRVWLLPLEIELRAALAELPKRRDRIGTLERELDQRIEQNRAAWQESRLALQVLQQTRSKLRTDDPQRATIDQQITVVTSAATDPARLGGKSDVRTKIVAWSAERNALVAAVRQIRADLPRLQDDYAALARDPQIAQTLRQLGEKQRLGPQRSYQAEVQKLSEYERLIFTRWVPVHWQGGQVRITGLFEDRAPLTFSFVESGEQQTLLTTTAAETAGISVPADAPRETIALAPDRQVTARRVELPYLRFGGCVLRGVVAYILPPEAEDWGCRIGRGALGEHVLRLEPERFRLWIDGD